MSKIRLNNILFALVAVVASAAIAQPFSSFLSGGSTQAPPTNSKSKPTITPALSPEEFKTQVNVKSKQAQQDLFRQAQTNLKQQTSQMPLPNSPPKKLAPGISPSQSTTTTTTNNNSASSTPPEDSNSSATTITTTTAPPPSSNANPAESSQVSGAATTQPAPAQTQTYTGFGGSTTQPQQPTSSTPSSQSSGGWSIKY